MRVPPGEVDVPGPSVLVEAATLLLLTGGSYGMREYIMWDLIEIIFLITH